MALIKINNRMINEMKEEFDLTFEQAIELLCADLASDKSELNLINVADLIKNDYSVADCLNREEKENYYKLIKGMEVNIPSTIGSI